MATVSCLCAKCGEAFYLNDHDREKLDICLLPTMKPTHQNISGFLNTWADWIRHVTTHCDNCRFVAPPSQCIQDLLQKVEEYKKMFPDETDPKLLQEISFTKKFNNRRS